MSSDETVKKGKRVSVASKDFLDIRPIVYSFKGPSRSHASGSVMSAARPPQWIYHDHVMGVIWMVFHKDKNYVGISQLQWCLRFLLDLKNSQGEYTADVEICIQAIQDDLIEQYAKLGPALEKSMEEKSLLKEKLSNVTSEDTLSAIKVETRDEGVRNERVIEDDETRKSIYADLTDSTTNQNNNDRKKEEEEEGDESFVTAQSQGITGTSTPKEEEPRTSKKINKTGNKYSKERCDSKCMAKGGKKKKDEILSFTYNEMISRGAEPCSKPYLIDDTYNDSRIEDSEEKQSGANLPDINSSDLVNFLNSSRQQHVDMINREMETLRILERLMKNINVIGFSGNNAEDTVRQLGNLEN